MQLRNEKALMMAANRPIEVVKKTETPELITNSFTWVSQSQSFNQTNGGRARNNYTADLRSSKDNIERLRNMHIARFEIDKSRATRDARTA